MEQNYYMVLKTLLHSPWHRSTVFCAFIELFVFSQPKNDGEQAYSCPRDQRLTVSWVPNWGYFLNPFKQHIIMVWRGERPPLNPSIPWCCDVWGVSGGVLNWAPMMSREKKTQWKQNGKRLEKRHNISFSGLVLWDIHLIWVGSIWAIRLIKKTFEYFPPFRVHTEKFFEFLLNQTELRLYLALSDSFGTKRTSVWFQIYRKMLNTIWFRFDLIRIPKKILCQWGSRLSA